MVCFYKGIGEIKGQSVDDSYGLEGVTYISLRPVISLDINTQIEQGSREGQWNISQTTWSETEEEKITNGDITVEIGDIITGYDPTDRATVRTIQSDESVNGYGNQVFELEDSSNYTWKVLGRDENGSLLITTANPIKTTSGDFELKGKAGLENAITELDRISSMFGQGANAISSRSIRIEDINKVTGFNPSDIDGNGTPAGGLFVDSNGAPVDREFMGEGGMQTGSEYGSIIKYSWGKDLYHPYYVSINGMWPTAESRLINYHEKFYYYDGTNVIGSSRPSNATDDNKIKIVELETTTYEYNEEKYPCSNNREKDLVYIDNDAYWLASTSVNDFLGSAWYNIRFVSGYFDYVSNYRMLDSSGSFSNNSCGVRPVITLSSNTNIKYVDTIDGAKKLVIDN